MKSEKGVFIKLITNKLISLIASEVNKPELQVLVRQQIIIPLIRILYSELYPYLIALVMTILLILIMSILTLLLAYFKR